MTFMLPDDTRPERVRQAPSTSGEGALPHWIQLPVFDGDPFNPVFGLSRAVALVF